MHFSGQHIIKNVEPNKNTLYCLNQSIFFSINENSDNSGSIDKVNCEISLLDNQEAAFGREYRAPYIEKTGKKRADLMCIMIDDANMQTETYIYEIKHSVTGPERVLDILSQIDGSIRQKKSMLMDVECEEYKENAHIGVITTGINSKSINERIHEITNEQEEIDRNKNKIPETIIKKKSTKMLAKSREAKELETFLRQRILYNKKEYPLEIINLFQGKDEHTFECKLKMVIEGE